MYILYMYVFQGAVQVLSMVQELLPPVGELNTHLSGQPALLPSPTSIERGEAGSSSHSDVNTTSEHYAVVESDHPYKPATVTNYRVSI